MNERSVVSSFAATLIVLLATPSLRAQFGPPPKPVTVLEGGTVHVGNGDVLENATVVVKGSRIEAVGKGLAAPPGATVVDVKGKHLYPGLIDVESLLGVDSTLHQSGEGNVTSAAVDAVDPFDVEPILAALRGGVTTVGVVSRRGLLDGRGVVVKLKPKASLDDVVLSKNGPLSVTLGINGDRPSMRLREWRSLADLLQATKKYAESWDEYAEKLADYKKDLEKAKKDNEGKKAEPKKEGAPAPAPAPKPEEAKPEEKKNGPPEGRPRGPRRRPGGSLLQLLRDLTGQVDLGGPEDPDDRDEEDARKNGLLFHDGVSYADGPPTNAPQQGQGGDKKDEPKKPGRPPRDPQKEVLRQVLEGKVALDVYLEHASDVLDLLDLAKQYHFDFFVTGAKEARHVARELEGASVTVVVVQSHDLASPELATAAELATAGVDVVITTDGQTGAASRHLSLAAAAAVAGGMEKERALAAITSRAAALLGVGDRVGTLEAGKDADVVVTNGELLSSTATVERVLVDGVTVVGH